MEYSMRTAIRSALLAALILAPASAMAWWPFQPSLPEQAARDIAISNGMTVITDVDRTIDADWKVKGHDANGAEVMMIIDGRSGKIEHAEMDAM
jgi:hypothetical protein